MPGGQDDALTGDLYVRDRAKVLRVEIAGAPEAVGGLYEDLGALPRAPLEGQAAGKVGPAADVEDRVRVPPVDDAAAGG